MSEPLTFQITKDEYLGVQWAIFRKLLIVIVLTIAVLGVVVAFIDSLWDGIPMIIGAALAFFVVRIQVRRTWAKGWDESPALNQPWKLAIEPDGLRYENAAGNGLTVWSALPSGRKTRHALMLKIQGPSQWVVIPHGAFASDADESDFVTTLESHGMTFSTI